MSKSTLSEHKLGRRMLSWINRFGQFEELFLGDPNMSIKRITALEVEITALKAPVPPDRRSGPGNAKNDR